VRALVVLNDPPYGTERSYNGLRLANALAKRDQAEVRLFLMGPQARSVLAPMTRLSRCATLPVDLPRFGGHIDVRQLLLVLQ
jgi:hypothetical protein